MNCKLFEQHYLDELDGQLDASLSAALHAHKDECAACQKRYEEAREGLQLARRYMVVHEPSPALDEKIITAAREALARQSASRELDDLSPKTGFFGWLNTLLASPSFRPVLAFCAVAVLVSGVYMYQSQHQGNLFAPKKYSRSGVDRLKTIPSGERYARQAPARRAARRQELAKDNAPTSATKGSATPSQKVPAPAAAAKSTAPTARTGSKSLDAPMPRRAVALPPKAPARRGYLFGVRKRPARRARRYRRRARRSRRRGRRYRRKARRRFKAAAKPKPRRRAAPRWGGDNPPGAGLQDPKRHNRLETLKKSKKKMRKRVRRRAAPAPPPAVRADDTLLRRKVAGAKEGDQYKRNRIGGARQPRFATPPPPARRSPTMAQPRPRAVAPAAPVPSAPKPAPQKLGYGRPMRKSRSAAGRAAGGAGMDLRGRRGSAQRSYTSLVNAAALSAQRGNTTQAIAQYNQALGYANGSQRAHVFTQLGILYLQRNDTRNARIYFDRAVRYTPKGQKRQLRERIYKIYRMRGKYQNAIKMLQRLKQLYPNRRRNYDRELRRLRRP